MTFPVLKLGLREHRGRFDVERQELAFHEPTPFRSAGRSTLDRGSIRSMHVRVSYPNRHDFAATPRSIGLPNQSDVPTCRTDLDDWLDDADDEAFSCEGGGWSVASRSN